MIESPIPQDILKYKAKFIGNFTAREAIWLTVGGISCLISFFFLFPDLTTNIKIIISACIGLPFFLIGFVRPLGQPIEKIAGVLIMDNFIAPPVRKNEVRHPELEKYERTRKWMLKTDEPEETLEENPEETNPTKKKKNAKKATAKKKNDGKIVIKPSKEFKGIK